MAHYGKFSIFAYRSMIFLYIQNSIQVVRVDMKKAFAGNQTHVLIFKFGRLKVWFLYTIEQFLLRAYLGLSVVSKLL